MTVSHRAIRVVGLSLIALIGVGCGASNLAPRSATSEPTAWARPTPPGASSGVVYVTRSSGLDDAIVRADVPGDIAAAAVVGDASPGHTNGDGHIGHLDRPPEQPGVASPSGEPVLLTGLETPLREGQHFALTVSLSSGASFGVDVVVSANPTTG